MTAIQNAVNPILYDFTIIIDLACSAPLRVPGQPVPPIILSVLSLPLITRLGYGGGMSLTASVHEHRDDSVPPDHAEAKTVSDPETPPMQPSAARSAWVGGHFDPSVVKALKTLALRENTTIQALIGRALNDLLEPAGLGRPASEIVLPRGGAAHRRRDRQPK